MLPNMSVRNSKYSVYDHNYLIINRASASKVEMPSKQNGCLNQEPTVRSKYMLLTCFVSN